MRGAIGGTPYERGVVESGLPEEALAHPRHERTRAFLSRVLGAGRPA